MVVLSLDRLASLLKAVLELEVPNSVLEPLVLVHNPDKAQVNLEQARARALFLLQATMLSELKETKDLTLELATVDLLDQVKVPLEANSPELLTTQPANSVLLDTLDHLQAPSQLQQLDQT